VSEPAAVLVATMHHRRTAMQQALRRVGWVVEAYGDVTSALAHLRERPFSAVFCDSYLRGASAGGFLAWSRRIAPAVPFYVIALNDASGIGASGQRPDAILAFPPVDADLPRPTTRSLWDAPAPAVRDLPLEGSTDLVSLADLIEMLAVTDASAVIALGGGMVGRVYLTGGQLEHAVHVGASDVETIGVRGLGRLLDLAAVDFQVLPYRTPSRRTVHVATATALTEASRLIDEQRRDQGLLESVAAACPDATGIAVGYALTEQPADVHGDGLAAFTAAVALLEAVRPSAGTVSHLAVEGERAALAVVRFGQERVLAAQAPRGRSVVLLSALAKAVKQSRR
jgi:hypothetical protein